MATNDYINLPVVGAGVTSLNGEAGALTLVAGSNITITPAGTNITIASSGTSGAAGGVLSGTYPNPDGLNYTTGNPLVTNVGGMQGQLLANNGPILLDGAGNLYYVGVDNDILTDNDNNLYLPSGQFTNGQQITDFSSIPSIDQNARQLLDTTGASVLDFNNGVFIGNLGVGGFAQVGSDLIALGTAGVISTPNFDTRTAQSASLTDTTIFTTNQVGIYELKTVITCTTGSAGGAVVSSQAKWTDQTNTAQTQNALSQTNVAMLTVGTFGAGSVLMSVGANKAIKYNTTVTGTISTSRYSTATIVTRIM